jgi:hypothetical protein
MPRKPRPPIEILRLEGLSDGRSVGKLMIDDFTGAPLPERTRTHTIPPSVQGVQDAANTQRHRGNVRVLAAAGILKDGRLSQPKARPWTERFAYSKRISTRRMVGCETEAEAVPSQPTILQGAGPAVPPRPCGPSPRTITLSKREWRRL